MRRVYARFVARMRRAYTRFVFGDAAKHTFDVQIRAYSAGYDEARWEVDTEPAVMDQIEDLIYEAEDQAVIWDMEGIPAQTFRWLGRADALKAALSVWENL